MCMELVAVSHAIYPLGHASCIKLMYVHIFKHTHLNFGAYNIHMHVVVYV